MLGGGSTSDRAFPTVVARASLGPASGSSMVGVVTISQSADSGFVLAVDVERGASGTYAVIGGPGNCNQLGATAPQAGGGAVIDPVQAMSSVALGQLNVDLDGRGHMEASLGAGIGGAVRRLLVVPLPGSGQAGIASCGMLGTSTQGPSG